MAQALERYHLKQLHVVVASLLVAEVAVQRPLVPMVPLVPMRVQQLVLSLLPELHRQQLWSPICGRIKHLNQCFQGLP